MSRKGADPQTYKAGHTAEGKGMGVGKSSAERLGSVSI